MSEKAAITLKDLDRTFPDIASGGEPFAEMKAWPKTGIPIPGSEKPYTLRQVIMTSIMYRTPEDKKDVVQDTRDFKRISVIADAEEVTLSAEEVVAVRDNSKKCWPNMAGMTAQVAIALGED